MDMIDRQKAIDALIDALAWTWSGTWSEKTAIDAIKNLPSAERNGKWDTFFSDSYKVHEIGVECSCCGYRTQERTNYCPNCGTRMEVDDE